MALSATQFTLLCVISVILLARPTYAFGAGNIGATSAIQGQNWRHGDIEDVLLTLASSRAMGSKKFTKLDVKRVYFGNWLRDYSQAVDVGTVKHVSAKAITLLLWILGFMSFGYGTAEFEVTMERLGCYRPEDHIDNPKNYADNEDARHYDPRLRGPVNERRELAIDPQTGLKAYIASENLGIVTSASHVRGLFGRCIELGRRYSRSHNKSDLYEALRLLGTACHCLEDYSAHSNYCELALIEMGERNVFPHVGRDTQMRLQGARHPVYPIITGTFGGVDFLHSVTGEFDDKVTQSEIQELESTMQQAQQNPGNTSMLQDLLGKLPGGMFGGKNEGNKIDELQANSAAHQMQNTHISPLQPEEWARYLDDVQKQIYPIIQFHDEIMQRIAETIEKIPILPALIESLQNQLNIFVFSLIAPFVLPVIGQIKTELNTGSSTIIQSSLEQQHIVFNDDRCTDPTHSMLSKDHFSNVLNEPAGKVAGQVLRWVVPQIINAWDDERIDINRTMNRIIRGIFNHPALRDYGDDGAVDGRRLMFSVVEQWWQSKDEREKDVLRGQLSREGVESGQNHKPGVVDHGHGSGKPLGMPRASTASSSGAPGGALGGILSQAAGAFGGSGGSSSGGYGQMAAEAAGGGALGAIVGGLASNMGVDMLGGGMNQGRQTYGHTSYGDDGSRTQTITQVGQSGSGNRWGQAEYSRTEEPYGGRTETYNRYEQANTSSGWQSEVHHEERFGHGEVHQETRRYGSGYSQENQYESGGSYGRRQEHQQYNENERTNYMPGEFEDDDNDQYQYGRHRRRGNDNEYGGRHQNQTEFGSGTGRWNESSQTSSYSRQEEQSSYSSNRYNRQEEQTSYNSNRYGRQEEDSNYGRRSEEREDRSYGRQHSREREENSNYEQDYERRRESHESGYGEREENYGRNQRRHRKSDDEESSESSEEEEYEENQRRRSGRYREESEY